MLQPPAPILYSDPIFLEHETGAHPAPVERLRYLNEYLKTHPIANKFQPGSFGPAQSAQLELVHTPAHVSDIQRFAESGGGRIEADTVMSPRSYDVACGAAGAALAAVDAVMTGDSRRAVCLIRPPGHHALP